VLPFAAQNSTRPARPPWRQYRLKPTSTLRTSCRSFERLRRQARPRCEMAEALNARGVATARGGQWYAMSVKNMLDRAVQSTSTRV
jgi:hypothetical protein